MKALIADCSRRTLLAAMVLIAIIATNSPAMARTYTIWVDGLACPFCSYGIEKQLSRLPGVMSVKTSLKSGTVILKTQGSRKISENDLRGAVDRAGFSVRKIK